MPALLDSIRRGPSYVGRFHAWAVPHPFAFSSALPPWADLVLAVPYLLEVDRSSKSSKSAKLKAYDYSKTSITFTNYKHLQNSQM